MRQGFFNRAEPARVSGAKDRAPLRTPSVNHGQPSTAHASRPKRDARRSNDPHFAEAYSIVTHARTDRPSEMGRGR